MLAPIVRHADDAHVPEPTRVPLIAVAKRYGLVACVSGRRAATARRIVSLGSITYVGNHGAEVLRGGATEVELDPEVAGWSPRMDEWAREAWNDELHRLRVRAEDKDVIRAYHWRGAPDEAAAEAAVRELAERAEEDGLVVHWGRKVLEVRPPVALNKGRGVEHLLDGHRHHRRGLRGRRQHRPRRLRGAAPAGGRRAPAGRRLRRRRLRRDARRARGPGRRARRRPRRRARAAVRTGRVAAGALRRPAQDDGHAQRGRGDDARDRHRHRRHAATATTRSC